MLIVQKFGGTSVADADRVRNVASIVADTYKAGNDVVVVVSAQATLPTTFSKRPMKSIPTLPKESLTCW